MKIDWEDAVFGILLVPVLALLGSLELIYSGINKIINNSPIILPPPLTACPKCNAPYHGDNKYCATCPDCKSSVKIGDLK